MELSEAKEILKQDWTVYDWVDEEDIEAIDTVLKALDNSISKDEVRKKIEECVKRRQELANGHFWENPSNINEDTALVMAQTLYQELLGEE
jgi:hypothetical protein